MSTPSRGPAHSVTPQRLAALLGDFDLRPAWAGLAEALQRLVSDGRLAHETRLPSERDLAAVLPVSRTTVTRAYGHLRDQGWAATQVGAGTWLRLPRGPRRSADRVLSPHGGLMPASTTEVIDLTCASSPAPPGVFTAFEGAMADLPGLLVDHGYFPAGLPELTARISEALTARGLPTVPDQIMVTPGALAATSVVAHALISPGDRVLVETPVYPNGPAAFVRAGARLVTLPLETRESSTLDRVLRTSGARAAYLVPEFQNPTGVLVSDEERAVLARSLARAGTIAVVDECHHLLNLDRVEMPLPLAAHVEAAGGTALTLGSASKAFWGGLRVGWIRAPLPLTERLTQARLALDLGSPVMEQLVVARLLGDPEPVVEHHRENLRQQRAVLLDALAQYLPDWQVTSPAGGMVLWCELPAPVAVRLADAAEDHGVLLTPGPTFCPEGGYRAHVRLPFTRAPHVLESAVERIARAWAQVRDEVVGRQPRDPAGRVHPPVVA